MQRWALKCFAVMAGTACGQAQTVSAPPRFTVAEMVEFDVGYLAFAPKWSPDGKWIAFSLPKSNGIGVVRADGTGSRTLTTQPGSGYKFAWSPDASRIVFRRDQPKQGLRHSVISVVAVAGGNIESSTGGIKEMQPPVWQRGPKGMR